MGLTETNHELKYKLDNDARRIKQLIRKVEVRDNKLKLYIAETTSLRRRLLEAQNSNNIFQNRYENMFRKCHTLENELEATRTRLKHQTEETVRLTSEIALMNVWLRRFIKLIKLFTRKP